MAKQSTAVKQDENEGELPENMRKAENPDDLVQPDQTIDQDAEDDQTEEERMKNEEMVQIFGSGLQRQFDVQVGLKEEIEQRWLDDLRHYNGVYDKETAKQIAENDAGSKIFVNLTRAKSNTAESKWSDLVLPTDDRNWGLKPTPVPTLIEALTDETPLKMADGTEPVDPETNEPHKNKDLAEATIKESKKKATAMENEMDDQLVEAKFNAVCRDVIHEAVVLGTGIIKGPMVERRTKKAWLMDESGQWALSQQEDYKPTCEEVDPWNLFPDMSATRWEDSEFVFERHLMVKKAVRLLAKQPGFMPEQIKKVLDSEPNGRTADLSYLNELREINGISQISQDNRYEILEYHGPIDKSDLVSCGCNGLDLENPLEEYEGVVWVCMGIVIKVGLNHMDSEELPYNILNWEKDDTSIFGFGIPYRMRAPQKVMNASWRMVLDNAGLSTGPQIIINRNVVEPADGKWELSPRKIWWMTTNDPKFRADYAMQTFDIDSKQPELTSIFEMAHRLADEETSVPQLNMGQTGADTQQPAMLKTLGGTALWMSANNIMMRRAVKNFDDDLVVPFLTRFYDWNMQFNENDEIKGDYNVDARGTSVLLVREMQSRNIMEFVQAALVMPGGPEELNTRGVMKQMAKGMQISVDDVMLTDDEAEAMAEELKTNPPPDPEMMKIEAQKEMTLDNNVTKVTIAREDAQLKLTLAEAERQSRLVERDTELTKLAALGQITMDKNSKEYELGKYSKDWDIRAFYEEMKIKKEEGETANFGLEPSN
jgi:hypothetical protein